MDLVILKQSILRKPLAYVMFLSLFFCLNGIAQTVTVGAGYSPLHRSAQSDFAPTSEPYDAYVMYAQGSLGVRLGYQWNSQYRKRNFSFENTVYELSLQFDAQRLFRLNRLHPYTRLGAVHRTTVFTTEEIPGITEYEFKIERDAGYGFIGAIGLYYDLGVLEIGIEGQTAFHGTSPFIAGGFTPQDLDSSVYRAMIFLQYTFPFQLFSSGRSAVQCPTF